MAVKRRATKKTRKVFTKRSKKASTMVVRDVNEQRNIGLNQASLYRRMSPKSLKTIIRYQEDIVTLNPGLVGIAACINMAANGVYDPYLAVGGHQPMGFDYYTQFYRNVVVTSSVITVRFTSSDGVFNNVVGIHLAMDNTLITSAATAIENGNTVFDLVRNTAISEGTTKTLSLTFNSSKFFGVKMSKDDANNYSTISANPGRLAVFKVFCAPLQNFDANGVTALITIDYNCEFFEPLEQALN